MKWYIFKKDGTYMGTVDATDPFNAEVEARRIFDPDNHEPIDPYYFDSGFYPFKRKKDGVKYFNEPFVWHVFFEGQYMGTVETRIRPGDESICPWYIDRARDEAMNEFAGHERVRAVRDALHANLFHVFSSKENGLKFFSVPIDERPYYHHYHWHYDNECAEICGGWAEI